MSVPPISELLMCWHLKVPEGGAELPRMGVTNTCSTLSNVNWKLVLCRTTNLLFTVELYL